MMPSRDLFSLPEETEDDITGADLSIWWEEDYNWEFDGVGVAFGIAGDDYRHHPSRKDK